MDKGKTEKRVVHLTIKGDSRQTDKHAYFGSVACIYDHYTKDQIGITYAALRNYGITEDKPYENKNVIIRRGRLVTKDQSGK